MSVFDMFVAEVLSMQVIMVVEKFELWFRTQIFGLFSRKFVIEVRMSMVVNMIIVGVIGMMSMSLIGKMFVIVIFVTINLRMIRQVQRLQEPSFRIVREH